MIDQLIDPVADPAHAADAHILEPDRSLVGPLALLDGPVVTAGGELPELLLALVGLVDGAEDERLGGEALDPGNEPDEFLRGVKGVVGALGALEDLAVLVGELMAVAEAKALLGVFAEALDVALGSGLFLLDPLD